MEGDTRSLDYGSGEAKFTDYLARGTPAQNAALNLERGCWGFGRLRGLPDGELSKLWSLSGSPKLGPVLGPVL